MWIHWCNIWYIDPQNGRNNNTGSRTSPWKSLNEIVPSKVDGYYLYSYPWDGVYPYTPSSLVRSHQNNTIKGGDVIVLLPGDYTNTFFNLTTVHNIPRITITQLPYTSGKGILLDTLQLTSTGGWNIYCLTLTTTKP